MIRIAFALLLFSASAASAAWFLHGGGSRFTPFKVIQANSTSCIAAQANTCVRAQ